MKINFLKYKIISDNAGCLLGTLYVPKGTLETDSEVPVADKSSCKAIIANELKSRAGSIMYLNSNYEVTEVPVPDHLLGGKPGLDQ